MKQRDLVDRALHAFSRKQWERARGLFRRAMSMGSLPDEELLYELGVSDLRCAAGPQEALAGIATLEGLPKASKRHGQACIEVARAYERFGFSEGKALEGRFLALHRLYLLDGEGLPEDFDLGALRREAAEGLLRATQALVEAELPESELLARLPDGAEILPLVAEGHVAFARHEDLPAALQAYGEAARRASGTPFERAVLSWYAFFREQVEGRRAALESYEALLGLLDDEEGRRRASVERKIAQLRRAVVEEEWTALRNEVETMVGDDEALEAEKRYLAFGKVWKGTRRAVDARWHAACLREQVLGDEDEAVRRYGELERDGDARSRKALERILEARLDEVEALRAQGEEGKALERLEATKESFGLRGEGEDRLIVARRELRRRQAEEEVRQLLEAGRARQALAVLQAFLDAYGHEAGARRLRAKAVAVAWHELGDASVVLDLLEGLDAEEMQGTELRMLVSDMVGKTAAAVKNRVRYGYRVAAFGDVARLYRRLRPGSKERKILRQVYLDELALGWTRLLQDRIREAAHGLMREKDRSSALWGKIQDRALGKGKGGKASDPTAEVAKVEGGDRLEKELEILRSIETSLGKHEDRALEGMSSTRYRELSEDEEGFRRFRALLDEVTPILEGFEHYAEGFHVEWKDFLGSFLPGSVRDRVVDQRYLDLIARQDELLSRVRAFLGERYGADE